MTTRDAMPELLTAAIRHDFQAFFERCFAELHPTTPLIEARYIEFLGALAEQIADGHIKFATIALPPRHLKSQIFSIALPCWLLGKDPHLDMIVSSHNEKLASDLAADRMRIFVSDWYRHSFPEFQFRPDRLRSSDFETSLGGGILSTTFGTGVSGRGADVIIVDDPIAITDQYSTVIRENAVRIFESELMSRRNDPKSARVVVVGHRIHANDLIGNLSDRDGWTHVSLPFEATGQEDQRIGWYHWCRSPGELLAPGRFDVASIQDIKSNHSAFQALYQQQPQVAAAGYVRSEHFPRQNPPNGGETVVSWDIASTTSSTSSYSAALVFKRIGDTQHLVHIWRGKEEFSVIKNVALDLQERFGPRVQLIEKTSSGPALAGELQERGIVVEQISPGSRSKLQRFEDVVSILTAKRASLPIEELAWIGPFLGEVTAFPAGAFDDQVDALTQYLGWCTSNPVVEPMGKVFRKVSQNSQPPMNTGNGSLSSLLPPGLERKMYGRSRRSRFGQ